MNPGLPTVEPWAHLLWINQSCALEDFSLSLTLSFFFFFNQVTLILPYLIFIIM